MRQSGKLILSLAGLTVATPVECKSEKRKEKKGNLIRPSQLPLYENPEDLYRWAIDVVNTIQADKHKDVLKNQVMQIYKVLLND